MSDDVPVNRGGIHPGLLVLVVAAIMAAAWWGLRSDEDGDGARPLVAFENTAPEVGYVGSEACRACHAAECTSYDRTYHKRSFGPVDAKAEGLPASFEHDLSGLAYEMYTREGAMRIREYLPLEQGDEIPIADHEAGHYIGSSRRLRTYLAERDGFLVQAPVSSYPRSQRWTISLGFDKRWHPGFTLALPVRCIECHVGRVEVPAAHEGRIRIDEDGIGCESCHGPGQRHVQHHQEGRPHQRGAFDPTIMNPARARRDQAMDVCSRCHASRDLWVERRDRLLVDWRPGLLLQDFGTRYRLEPDDGALITESHADQLRESRCFQASPQMQCATCHDAHVHLDVPERPTRYRQMCLACHAPEHCGMPEEQRLETTADDSCVVCHMPRIVEPRPHGVYTHHRIGVHLPPEAPTEDGPRVTPGPSVPIKEPGEGFEMRPVTDVTDYTEDELLRGRALAWMRRMGAGVPSPEVGRAWTSTARGLLEEAHEGTMEDDPATLLGLALVAKPGERRLALDRVKAAAASQEKVPRHVHHMALSVMARILFEGHQYEESRATLETLTRIRFDPQDWLELARVTKEMGDREAAVRAADRLVEVYPESTNARWFAMEIYRWAGEEDKADEQGRIGELLRVAK